MSHHDPIHLAHRAHDIATGIRLHNRGDRSAGSVLRLIHEQIAGYAALAQELSRPRPSPEAIVGACQPPPGAEHLARKWEAPAETWAGGYIWSQQPHPGAPSLDDLANINAPAVPALVDPDPHIDLGETAP